MSVEDAAKLLNREQELFVFIPPVGYLYLFLIDIQSTLFTNVVKHEYLYLLIISIFTSSYIYNYSLGNPEKTGSAIKGLFLISLLSYFVLFAHVNLEIVYYLLSNEPITIRVYGAIILFVSLVYISVLFTHRIIRRFSKGYEREL